MALQMAKSQKLSKEEQELYEQALQYHKQHQMSLNKTQGDVVGGSPRGGSQPTTAGQKTFKQTSNLNVNLRMFANNNVFPYPDSNSTNTLVL